MKTKEAECDDINSGSAVVFVAHGEGERGSKGTGRRHEEQREAVGEKSQEGEGWLSVVLAKKVR